MTDIYDKAVEATAKAMCDDDLWPGAWIETIEVVRDAWMRRARAAVAAYEAAMWQPIETAPRDGMPIDLWIIPPSNSGPRDFPIYIGAHASRTTDATPCYRTAWESCGRTITGRRFYDDDGDQCLDPDDTSERATRATHWRPLPPPPGGASDE